MTDKIDLSKLTAAQLTELKARIRAARPVVKYRSLVNQICDIPPEKSKEILCKIARDNQEKAMEGKWQKLVLNAIKNQI